MATTKTIKSVISAAILAAATAHAGDMHQVFQCDLDDHQQVTAYAQNGVVWYGYVNDQTHQSWEYPNDDDLTDNHLLTLCHQRVNDSETPHESQELWFSFIQDGKQAYAVLTSGTYLRDKSEYGFYSIYIDGRKTSDTPCTNGNIYAEDLSADISSNYFAKGYQVSSQTIGNTYKQ
ncbi:hypothetical protein [Enterobacter roggenkampii]|uniref:hypothetical protein n=1 Tax=Enterobacter roggenkampii TaxID=1812935 RepID=UPI001C705A7A|nr:hypothetical protein [Enterobacter roggenkampii]MBW9467938.1 hypothetical protein [Enterobacter roggenkampii]